MMTLLEEQEKPAGRIYTKWNPASKAIRSKYLPHTQNHVILKLSLDNTTSDSVRLPCRRVDSIRVSDAVTEYILTLKPTFVGRVETSQEHTGGEIEGP